MTDPFARLRRILGELKRRNVYRVAVTYVIASFVVLQLADLAAGAFGFPGWFEPMIWVVAGLGFPLALVLAWAFEMTSEGVRRTPTADESVERAGELAAAQGGSTETRRSRSRRAVGALMGLGLVGAAVAGGWYLTGGTGTIISDQSVAVLPFETLGDTESTPFTEGLHNDLLTRLQRVSDLTVIARPSVMRYEDTDQPLEQVAEDLNARWIVTAAVQSAGDRVQVNPRLIDPRTGAERWSDSYRGELSADLFDLQEEITRSIADALEAELESGERERLEERPTGDLEAYRLYVQGRRQFARRSGTCPSCVVEAVTLFRRAIERDSTFAEAWAGLADAAAASPPHFALDSIVSFDVDAEFAARRALALDPDLAEAHASMGHVHLRKMDGPAARWELERAIELKPSYWEAHYWLGEMYLKTGWPERALDHLELALELNPQHALARHWLYDAYLATGQPEKSLQEARRQERMGLEQVDAVAGEIRALYHLDRLDEAGRLAQEQVPKLDTGFWPIGMRGHLAAVLAAQGDTAGAREQLDWLRSEESEPYWIGFGHAAVGETDQAFEAWARMDDEAWGRIPPPHHLRYGILLDMTRLGNDPRYPELIREANRAWGLNPDGSFPPEGKSDA